MVEQMLKSLFLALCLISSALWAQGANTKTFVVGIEGISYYPFYSCKNEKCIGYGLDVLAAFAKHKGYHFIFKPFPVTRTAKACIGGKIDFCYPDNPTWAQERKVGYKVYYSGSVGNFTDGLIVLPKNKGKGIGNLKTVGTITGFTVWALNNEIKKGSINVDYSNDLQGLVSMALKERVDALYANVDVVKAMLAKHHSNTLPLIFDEKLPYSEGYYALSTTTRKEIIDELNHFLETEKETINKIKKKYKLL